MSEKNIMCTTCLVDPADSVDDFIQCAVVSVSPEAAKDIINYRDQLFSDLPSGAEISIPLSSFPHKISASYYSDNANGIADDALVAIDENDFTKMRENEDDGRLSQYEHIVFRKDCVSLYVYPKYDDGSYCSIELEYQGKGLLPMVRMEADDAEHSVSAGSNP